MEIGEGADACLVHVIGLGHIDGDIAGFCSQPLDIGQGEGYEGAVEPPWNFKVRMHYYDPHMRYAVARGRVRR